MSRTSGGHDHRFAEAWEAAGYHVDALATGDRHDNAAGVSSRLKERIDAFSPDIVQVGPVTYPAWELVHVWSGPLIATSWGFDLLQEVDHGAGVTHRVQEVLARANLLILDNDALRKRAIELGIDEERIVQFPWGLDDQWFEPRMIPPMDDPTMFTLLCTRRHESLYRVGDVLSSFVDAASTCRNIRLQLVGSGSLTPELRAQAAASDVADRIEFLGELDNERLPELYRQADIYVTASEVDGTSVSLLEALASGTVVVASLNEGNTQWLSDATGYGFRVADTDSLTHIMVELAGSDHTRIREARHRALQGRALVQGNANWRSTAKRFSDFARAATDNWEHK